MRMFRLAAWVAVAAGLGGCVAVQPYQRGYLARDDMALDANPGTTRVIEKTYSAKEAASGGASVGGGGCGCN